MEGVHDICQNVRLLADNVAQKQPKHSSTMLQVMLVVSLNLNYLVRSRILIIAMLSLFLPASY
jgi:hypothetical protein